MKGRISLVVAAAIAMTIIGGCTVPSPPSPAPSPSATSTPTTTPAPTGPPTSAGAPVAFNVYFAYNEKMQPAPRTAPAGTKAVLRAALEALLEGPSVSERKGGLSTAVPSGTRLLGVTINANVAVVDLSGRFDFGGGTLSMTDRLAQVVFTATQFPGVDAVTFKLDGRSITVFSGEGIVLDGPQTRKAFEDASPAILVERPAWRGSLAQGAAVRGSANVFEAVFRLQVRDTSGNLVMDRAVQASGGTGTRGQWKLTATIGAAKAGVGTLRVFAQSAKDGSPIDVVTIPVILAP